MSRVVRLQLIYAPVVGSDLWVGAITTLSGAVLGGTISFVLSRQQMSDARAQREEEALREKGRRSIDRRFTAYADFLTRARSYRNAIRILLRTPAVDPVVDQIDDIAASADAASTRVFLVVENEATYKACRSVTQAMAVTQELLHIEGANAGHDRWHQVNDNMAASLREFQAAAREELGISGVERSWIIDR